MNKIVREGFVEDEPNVSLDDVVTPAKAKEKEAAPPPPRPEEEWPIVIRLLHRKVQKGPGDYVSELIFREPSAGDILRAGGNPCRIEVVEVTGAEISYKLVIDDAKMMRLMANLSGVLEPFLQKMDPRDYNSCAHRLRRFFLPEQGVW